MNTPTPGEHDDEFEATLRTRRRFVPRLDDGVDDAGPSLELDRKVLARARAELRPATPATPPVAKHRHYRGPRWAVPLALVATVLLSFTLVMQLDPGRNDAVLAPSQPATVATPTEAETGPGVTEPSADAATTERAAQPALELAAPATADASSSPRSAPATRGDAMPPPQGDVMPAPASAAPSAPAIAAREASDYAANDATAVAKSAAPTDSTPARSRLAAPMAAATATDAARAMEERAQAVTSTEDDQDTQAWLERIERLRRAGEFDAARTQLAEFRRRHPDVALPPALRDLR